MSYNLTSALFIAIFSFFFFGEYHGKKVLFAVILGFTGMLLIYKPVMHFPWYYHATGLTSGIISAIAYITLGRLAAYYDSRVIVLSFLVAGVLLPSLSLLIHYSFGIPADGLFIIDWKWPAGKEWFIFYLWGLPHCSDNILLQKLMVLIKQGSFLYLDTLILFTLFLSECYWVMLSRPDELGRDLLHHYQRRYHLPL